MKPMCVFSADVERALHVAFEAHAGQQRKAAGVPYVTHPVQVALMLARVGADEVTLQAALLHDVVEDCEGWTLERLRSEVGDEVRDTVEPLTEVKGGTWRDRKEAALSLVPSMSLRSAAVKAADKTHNMRSLWRSLEGAQDSAEVWRHFSRGPEETIGFAERLVGALCNRLEGEAPFGDLVTALRGAFDDLAKYRT